MDAATTTLLHRTPKQSLKGNAMKKLNITAITAIVATLAAGLLISAAAQADTTATQTGLTRAEVKAQLAEARAKGEIPAYRPAADFSDVVAPAAPSLTRAEVRNAVVAAEYNGEFAKLNSEDPQRRLPVATPAQVRRAETGTAE